MYERFFMKKHFLRKVVALILSWLRATCVRQKETGPTFSLGVKVLWNVSNPVSSFGMSFAPARRDTDASPVCVKQSIHKEDSNAGRLDLKHEADFVLLLYRWSWLDILSFSLSQRFL